MLITEMAVMWLEMVSQHRRFLPRENSVLLDPPIDQIIMQRLMTKKNSHK